MNPNKIMSWFYTVLIFMAGFVWSSQASRYNMDILEFEYNITTPDNFDMEWKVVRPSRGVFAVNGFFNFKQDFNTDNAIFSADIYYSTNGMSYMLTPFRMSPSKFTASLNNHYRIYLMDTIKVCCVNPIDFEGRFVAPLTKRLMECKNCMFNADNFPTNMRLGYYKVTAVSINEVGFTMTTTLKLDEE